MLSVQDWPGTDSRQPLHDGASLPALSEVENPHRRPVAPGLDESAWGWLLHPGETNGDEHDEVDPDEYDDDFDEEEDEDDDFDDDDDDFDAEEDFDDDFDDDFDENGDYNDDDFDDDYDDFDDDDDDDDDDDEDGDDDEEDDEDDDEDDDEEHSGLGTRDSEVKESGVRIRCSTPVSPV